MYNPGNKPQEGITKEEYQDKMIEGKNKLCTHPDKLTPTHTPKPQTNNQIPPFFF